MNDAILLTTGVMKIWKADIMAEMEKSCLRVEKSTYGSLDTHEENRGLKNPVFEDDKEGNTENLVFKEDMEGNTENLVLKEDMEGNTENLVFKEDMEGNTGKLNDEPSFESDTSKKDKVGKELIMDTRSAADFDGVNSTDAKTVLKLFMFSAIVFMMLASISFIRDHK